jgi:hypothetical protein
MSTPTLAESGQLTAPNRSIDAANGVSYAYRRFGNHERGAPPLVFLQHFRLSIYPGANHGFLFQYPEEFAAEVNGFLG